jgi:hypothetical protein
LTFDLPLQRADVEDCLAVALRLEADGSGRLDCLDSPLPAGRAEVKGLASQLRQELPQEILETVIPGRLEGEESGNCLRT